MPGEGCGMPQSCRATILPRSMVWFWLRQTYRYALVVVVIVRNETTATARWALLFIFRAFVNDSITVAVWTSFHVCTPRLPMLIRQRLDAL